MGKECSRLDDWVKKWCGYWFIYRAILFAVSVGVILLFRFDFYLGMVTLVFAIYSWYWYQKGFYNRVVDEYKEGYPKDGLRWMFGSWVGLIVVLTVIYFCFVSEIFLNIVLGVILFIFVLFMFFVFK